MYQYTLKTEQDKSSDIEQQPPFGDRKKKEAICSLKIGGVTKPTGTSYNFDKVWSGAPDQKNTIHKIALSSVFIWNYT